MIENHLTLINCPDDKPTCFSRAWKTSTWPDIAMATDDIQKHTNRGVCHQIGGSDHLPVLLSIAKQRFSHHRMEPSWNIKKANWKLFRERVDEACQDLDLPNCLNTSVQKFTDTVLQAAKFTIPRGKRRNYKPYWTKKLNALHSELNTAREVMETDPTLENTRQYNEKDEFHRQKVQDIRDNWNEKTSKINMEDTSKLWNLAKALNEDSTPARSATVLEEEGKHCSGRQAANILAEHYKTVSTATISPARQKQVRQEMSTLLKHQNPSNLITAPFTMAELTTALKKLKTGKSPGKDVIMNSMIKNLGFAAKSKLLEIYNKSWETGKFPDKWREAIIVPIWKKGKDKSKKASYRPISLLCCFGKVMERTVNARLLRHLEQNNLLGDYQSAYRKNRSTDDQLEVLAQEVENAFQMRHKVLAVFIDLTSAFDKVWKDGLLLKLLRGKVEGNMFRWIRLPTVQNSQKLDGHMSRRVSIQQGVPQGGVVSPTLFIIFINDIVDKLKTNISRALHADDLAIWNSAECLSAARHRIQEALDHISEWGRDWGVEINTTKTVSSIFSLSNQKEQVNLQMNKREIQLDETPKYLGVRMDKRLTWKSHIQEVEGRAIKRLSIMKKLAGTTWGADGNILKKVYRVLGCQKI